MSDEKSVVWIHKTQKGRVVYNRKLHKFTEKDILRITRQLKEATDIEESGGIPSILKTLTLFFIDRILGALSLVGVDEESIYNFLLEVVSRILEAFGVGRAMTREDIERIKEANLGDDLGQVSE